MENQAVVRVERRGVKFCQPQHRSDLRLSSILTMNPRKLISTSASQKCHPEHLLPCLGHVAGPQHDMWLKFAFRSIAGRCCKFLHEPRVFDSLVRFGAMEMWVPGRQGKRNSAADDPPIALIISFPATAVYTVRSGTPVLENQTSPIA